MWEGKDVRKAEVHSREGMFLSVAFFALDYSELIQPINYLRNIIFSIPDSGGRGRLDGWNLELLMGFVRFTTRKQFFLFDAEQVLLRLRRLLSYVCRANVTGCSGKVASQRTVSADRSACPELT